VLFGTECPTDPCFKDQSGMSDCVLVTLF